MKAIDQSTVLITGAAGGIGLACARAFRDAGAKVMMTDVDEKARELCSDRVRFIKADLRDERQLKDLVETTLRDFGSLDILVNNAAVITPTAPVHETTVEQLQLLIDVNVRAPFLLVKYAYPHLKASKGSIINVSSMAGVAGEKHHAAYAATKGALNALTYAMAIDYGREGIRVNAIAPSSVITPNTDRMIESANDPAAVVELRKKINLLGYTSKPEEIASVVLFLASPAASFITGAVIPVSGGTECGYGVKY